ncbi:YraN family protein [Nocardioides sp. B-3]|uniref:YraN family protein n=1 Tax=Nocardioides sp. B-3 TaxID=2895565 RepID=UPI00215217DB|nr:YraN family protein [Nocardioides sp. B-3]UUZ59811.1 YraN family protein [Nocardioides sp. B-3]
MDSTASPPRLTHNRALGAYGELLAARYLTQQGMVLLDHNWRCPIGELDLVLREGKTPVICEVKTRRSNDYGTPHEAIDRTKVERLGRPGRRVAAGPHGPPRRHPARPRSRCSSPDTASPRSTTSGG